MNTSNSIIDPVCSAEQGKGARVLGFMRQKTPGLIKTTLYLGLTYIALFVGVSECHGQCAYYVYHATCWNGNTENCYSDYPGCDDCLGGTYCLTQGGLRAIGCGCVAPPHSLGITGGVTCPNPGNGAWCLGGASLVLTATDSDGGHAVSIGGTINGSSFGCGPNNGSTTCSNSLGDGYNLPISYYASCPNGPTGTTNTNWSQDSVAPFVSTLLTGGTPGNAPWITGGTVAFTCTVSDALSGAGSVVYGTSSVSSDGIIPVTCTGYDVAGNSTPASATVYYDGTPPVISGTVGGTPVSGWYNGFTSLSCTATDATSGLANIFYGVMTATTAGPTTLDCTAVDVAGNSSSYSTVVLVDNVLPTASFSFNGNYCANDWYNSPVYVGMTVFDAHSGPAGGRFLVDGAEWDSSQPIKDGEHVITAIIADLAGNTATPSVTLRVDTFAPMSSWSMIDEDHDGELWYGGTVLLQGNSVDWTSGIALVEISLDGGKTWIPVGSSSAWSYEWDTLAVSDGAYELQARAKDNACNQEHTGYVTIKVDNTPPDLSLENSLVVLGNSTAFIADDSGSGVAKAKVTISGNGIDPRVLEFSSSGGKQGLDWDGRDGNGAVAPFGIYDVVVEVWDKVGNYSITTGTWVRPKPEDRAPIAQPTAMPPAEDDTSAIDAAPDASETASARPNALPFWSLVLPLGALGVWLAGSSIAFGRDRRWSELRGIRETITRYRDQNKINFPQEGEE
jgi:hypothetical protein